MANTESENTHKIPNAHPEKKSEHISAVWIIPIIAAFIGGWLVFKNAVEEKTVASVTFKNASGIEAGKTAVKYRNVKIGIVKKVRFSDDLANVVAVIEFKGLRQERLTDDTRFWIVKPRIGISGVSGLDTLLSGVYIEVDPGDGSGNPTQEFTGQENPDIHQLGNPGTKYLLSSSKLGTLSRGSPVEYRDINVGIVTRYKLADDHSHVEVEIFVRAPHDKYINNTTRFWNISGLKVELGAEGIKMDMASIESLLSGGIAFTTKNTNITAVPQAAAKTVFTLYDTEKPKAEETLNFAVPLKIYFDEGVSGLKVGAPVEFKGLRLGTVLDIGVEANTNRSDILTFAIINVEPDRLPAAHHKQYPNDEQRKKGAYLFIEKMVHNGLRAQLRTRNLLTGQSLVAFDFFPGQKKSTLKYVNNVPVLPSMPESLSGILQQVDRITAQIAAMPLEDVSKNLDKSLVSINSLVKSLNASEGGMLGVQINEAILELTKAARSIRSMADYLERHPESLLKGKSSQ